MVQTDAPICSVNGCEQDARWRHPTDENQMFCTTHYASMRTDRELLADLLATQIETNHLLLALLRSERANGLTVARSPMDIFRSQ